MGTPLNHILDRNGMDRDGATAYAEYFATDDPEKRNPHYPTYGTIGTEEGSSNCANYVSQCLVEGGGLQPVVGQWYMSPKTDPVGSSNEFKVTAKIVSLLFGFDVHYNAQDPNYNVFVSSTWNNANDQYIFFSNPKNGYINGDVIEINAANAIPIGRNSGIQPGDILYWDYDGDGLMDHVTIVTGIDKNGDILYSGNSEKRRNQSLSEILQDNQDYKLYLIKLNDSVFGRTMWDYICFEE